MLVKQLSVFMENRPGRLYKLTNALGKAGIDFVTLSIADTKDFGIVRFIARDNERAYEILKKEGFTVGITELIGVEVDDKPNALAEVVALMEEANMNIEYLYSFVLTNHNSAKICWREKEFGFFPKRFYKIAFIEMAGSVVRRNPLFTSMSRYMKILQSIQFNQYLLQNRRKKLTIYRQVEGYTRITKYFWRSIWQAK